MKRNKWIHRAVLGVCLAVSAACGSNGSGSANPAAPSTPSMNLAGSWAGKMAATRSDGRPDSNPGVVAWTASQNGSSVSGPLTLTFNNNDNSGVTLSFRGTLSGTLSGTQLALTLSFPAGTFVDVPACAITGTGTATPTTSAISSSVTITFGAACVGTISDQSSEIDQLTLTKS